MPGAIVSGLGIVSPIGVGAEAVGASLRERRGGVRRIDWLERAGWIAPFGAEVLGFDAKAHVEPRKSLKVMARETQLAFAAAEMAFADAGLTDSELDPERFGVIGAAGMLYCPLDELAPAFAQSLRSGGAFDYHAWGERGMRELFPLWMLKYLPNMAACHVGIRRDARGPTNTIALGDVSSLVAIGEAFDIVRRGAADVMLAGGASSRLDLTDLLWRRAAGLSLGGDDPGSVCRPFDRDRTGSVVGEGAAFFVVESDEHFARRSPRRRATPWGRVLAAQCRCEPAVASRLPTGRALFAAASAALQAAGGAAADLAMVKAHGASRVDADAVEAAALAAVVGHAPVTAPTSYFGSIGPAGGAVELAAALIGWREGVVPATLNYHTPDPACPLSVSGEPREAPGSTLLAVNYAPTGQAAAVLIGKA